MEKMMSEPRGPTVTIEQIEDNIASEHYFTAAEGVIAHANLNDEQPQAVVTDALKLLTFCVLVLKNGFTVTGESACASPANYNQEKGREVARKKAIEKCWPLLGYELRTQLAQVEYIDERERQIKEVDRRI